jgi:hypothetical protein
MNQALYAHMNNKRKKKKEKEAENVYYLLMSGTLNMSHPITDDYHLHPFPTFVLSNASLLLSQSSSCAEIAH